MSVLWPPSWCGWSEWSVCSIEPCIPARLNNGILQKLSAFPDPETLYNDYCVNSTDLPITVLHWPEGTNIRHRVIKPLQKRSRLCRCLPTRDFFGGLFSRNCKDSDMQVECHTCFEAGSRVYTRFSPSPPTGSGGGGTPTELRSCVALAEARAVAASDAAAAAAFANSVRFYGILGGALGAALLVATVICCARLFDVSTGGSGGGLVVRRRRHRRGRGGRDGSEADQAERNGSGGRLEERGGDGGGLGSGGVGFPHRRLRYDTVNNLMFAYPHFLNTELPPAYKDVVAMTTTSTTYDLDVGVALDGTEGHLMPPLPPLPINGLEGDTVSPDAPSNVYEEIDNAGVGGTGDDGIATPAGEDGPPPPSYQEVIAFSPSAADMHQRMLAEAAASAVVATSTTTNGADGSVNHDPVTT